MDNAEFVEIYNGTGAPVDLSNYAVVLVNGSTMAEYARIVLSGTLAPRAYAVVANAGVSVPTGVPTFSLADDILQNGAPDGVALVNTSTQTLVDALSYEGAIASATITGIRGTVSLVEGTLLPATVADSNVSLGSLARIPSGSDTNDAATDWMFVPSPTPGAANAR